MPPPTLHLLCGKIASGKSTLAAQLSNGPGVVLISEDTLLTALFGDQMKTGADFLTFSAKLRAAIAPHVVGLLRAGVSVVLDFAANTLEQRAWMRGILSETEAAHQLHFLDVPDALCLERLKARNAGGDHAFSATQAQFYRFTKAFVAPTAQEGFTIIRS